MWAPIINILLGLLVTVSPELWQLSEMEADNNHIIGPLIIAFSVISLWEYNRNVRYVNILTAAWLINASLLLRFQLNTLILNVSIGLIVLLLSLVKGRIKKRYGGGWRSLWQKNPLHMRDG